MFKNKECVGHMVGGAVIGVAVGMLMQKILSPRSEEEIVDVADKDHPMCQEKVKRRSRKNLQVPLHHHKNHSHRHQCRSKSACCSKHVEKERLSTSTNSQEKSKLSASDSDLCSSNTKKSEKNRKTEASTKQMTTDEKSTENVLNTSTEYLPYESKVPKIFSGNPTSDNDNQKSDITMEKLERSIIATFEMQDIETMSTEYLMLPKLTKHLETPIQPVASDIIDCTITNSLAIDDQTNWSSNATCDTENEDLSSHSNSNERAKITETELLEGLDNHGFVTLPTFYESSSLATEYIEN